MSTADDDQRRAAVAHAEVVLGRHEDALPGGGIRGDDIDPPPFLVAAVERFNEHAAAGTLFGCRHVTAAPAVRVMAVWRPGFIACPRCAAAGMLGPGEGADADRRCDACGTVEPDGVHMSITHAESMLVYFGLCDRCFTDIVGPFERPERPPT